MSQRALPQTEVDFVAIKNGTTEYYQVAFTVAELKTLAKDTNDITTYAMIGRLDETTNAGIVRINDNAFEQANGMKINYTIGARRSGDLPVCYANADKALYHSKGNGKDTYSFFTDIADKEEKE